VTERGQIGEFRLKPVIMKGYVGNPEETAKAFDSENRYKTGDLGYIDADGDVYVVDRIKEMIKYRGYQVRETSLNRLIFEKWEAQKSVFCSDRPGGSGGPFTSEPRHSRCVHSRSTSPRRWGLADSLSRAKFWFPNYCG